jgi:hypothetical protein
MERDGKRLHVTIKTEWLIVRVVEGYGEFMNHTPWYRFPYMSVIAMYWSTLARESRFLISLFKYLFYINMRKSIDGEFF